MAAANCPIETLIPGGCGVSQQTLDSVLSFQEESLKSHKEVQESQEFQESLKRFTTHTQKNGTLDQSPDTRLLTPVTCYVFVSFSMGEKAILNLAEEAKTYGATLVLRGFKEGSFRKTVAALSKIILKTGQGILIAPELFSLFEITSVPTFILAKESSHQFLDPHKMPLHDRLRGHVSLRYVLETFSKEGNLKDKAKTLLKRGESP